MGERGGAGPAFEFECEFVPGVEGFRTSGGKGGDGGGGT